MRRLLLLAPLLSLLLLDAALARQTPRTAEEFYARGVERLRGGDADAALADFDRAVTLRPDFADAYFARASAWGIKEKGSDFAEGIKARDAVTADLDKAVTLDPERAEFRTRRAVHMLRFAAEPSDYDAIIADFGKAIALEPSDALPYFLRASVLMLKEEFPGALADFDRAVSLAPAEAGYVGARAWLKLAFLADYEGAVADAGRAIRLGGDGNYEWYATRGKALSAAGRRADGARDLRRCRRLDQRCAGTLRKLDMLMRKFQRRPPTKN